MAVASPVARLEQPGPEVTRVTPSGVDFGPVNFAKLAESFGAGGLKIDHPDEITPTLKKALTMEGPVVVAIPVDYRDNHRLMEILRPDVLN